MKVTSERIEGCRVALTVEIEPEEMSRAVEGAYRRLAYKVMVPGFRKGKAPRAMLERHLGKEAVDAEALDHLVPELYDRAIQQEAIEAIARPDLEMVQLDPPIFKATVPVRPVVELGDYRSVRVTPEKVEITEEDVLGAIERLRRLYSTWEPANREARLEDMVIADITGTVEGKEIIHVKDSQYKLAADSQVPVAGFAEQLLGMQPGQTKEFTLRFPDDYHTAELRGKEGAFKVTLSEIKEQRLPEVDDAFAKSVSEGVETVEQLKERIRQNLQAAAEQDARGNLESRIMEEIIKVSKVEFPAVLTENEIVLMAEERLRSYGGMKFEDYLRIRKITAEEFKNELRPAAEKRVTGSLVLNKLHEAEGIQVSEADIDAEIERIIKDSGEHGERVKEVFKSPAARDSVRGRLLTQKTLDRLVEIATAGGSASPSAPAEDRPAE